MRVIRTYCESTPPQRRIFERVGHETNSELLDY
jgi:hypothetical protein